MAEVTKRLVLRYYGTHEPRGGWFDMAQRTALTQAASVAGHMLFDLERAKLDQIDPDLLGGVLGASGRVELLPAIRQATFDRLVAMIEAGQVGKVTGPGGKAVAAGVPMPWSEIRVDVVVLAFDDDSDGWWEAVVTAVDDDGRTLRLRWRDYPDLELFSKPILRVGLISPAGQR